MSLTPAPTFNLLHSSLRASGFLILCGGLAACSGESPSPSDGASMTDGGSSGGTSAEDPTGGSDGGEEPQPSSGGQTSISGDGDYPAGPYGESDPEVGAVIENLALRGYERISDGELVNQGEIVDLSMSDLRIDGANYALIHTATVWCPSCRTAADDLSLRADELSGRGVVVVELLLEGAEYNAGILPTDEELNLWVTGSDLTMTTVRPDARGQMVFPSREYVYIVELATMKVVWAERALFTDPSITEQGIDAMFDLFEQ